jgi:hypothetical protein
MGKLGPRIDLCGIIIYDFIIEKYIVSGKWQLRCLKCNNIRTVYTGDLNRYLRKEIRLICECSKIGSRVINLVGNKYSKLTVLDEPPIYKNNNFYWRCKCDCGNENVLVRGSHLTGGDIKSCGCLLREKLGNNYDLNEACGVGYTSKNEKFYFDVEDYELIKDYTWYISNVGYVVNHTNNIILLLHRLIMNCKDHSFVVDHIDRNPLNNRKNNLRITDERMNQLNRKNNKNNKWGVMGVYKNKNTWTSTIRYYGKDICLGRFDNFEDAAIARLKFEKENLGECASQRHLFEEYGLNNE